MHDTILDQTYEYSESYNVDGELRTVGVTFENDYVKFRYTDDEVVTLKQASPTSFERAAELVRNATAVLDTHGFDVETPLNQ